MAGPEQLLDVLLAGRRAGRLTHVRTLPPRPAGCTDWPAWADPDLVRGWQALGVERPWHHQVLAAEAAWSGRHTVLSTSTGSGKSLAFWLPVLSAVRADATAATAEPGRIESVVRRGTTLYLSPTKALAADQLAAVDRLLTASHTRDVQVATCDGDTARDERRWVAEHADVVLTNPDFLHASMLPDHARWSRFLAGLRFVVVDECHAYRGVFGAHVAAVLRRLRRLAGPASGPGPVFVLASATTTDPALSAARLVGVPPEDVLAVMADTSPAGPRTIALWQPPELPGAPAAVRAERSPAAQPLGDPGSAASLGDVEVPGDESSVADATEDRPRRTATAETSELITDLVTAGARALAFTRSRRGAESVAATVRDRLGDVDPALAGTVAAYRGGYLPEERRALEQAIRTGRLRALATTNALELGVDISGLDAVVVAGWPGSRTSWWQQAGRAGRAGSAGLVVLVAREDPLDTYLVQHPEALLDAPVEATVFDPTNPYVLAPHLCAAAAERPLRTEDLALFGPGTRELLDLLVAQGALRRRPSGWYWTHPERASRLTDLRGTGGDPVRVVEARTGRLLGTVDAASADATVHPGAVYVHQAATFVVEDLDQADGVALVERRDTDYRTWARWVTSIDIRSTGRARRWGPVDWGFGEVDVTTQVVGYQRRRLPDLQVVGSQTLNLPARSLPTTAVWWTVPAAVADAAGVSAEQLPGALHAAEHAAIGMLPLLATCDRWDLGGLSTVLHVDTEQATVFVHDACPGGAGLAERAYGLGATWLRATRDAIAACRCARGCPGCVQSPKCGNANSPLDKQAAVRLLDAVLAHAQDGPPGLADPRPGPAAGSRAPAGASGEAVDLPRSGAPAA